MRSREIHLQLSPSKLPLIALLLVFICCYLISCYLPTLKYVLFGVFILMCLFWLYKYLGFKQYNLIFNTTNKRIWIPDQVGDDKLQIGDGKLRNENNRTYEIPLQIAKIRHISWWLCIIYILTPKKVKKIYLFVDSIPFKSYKTFKIYSQWT
ncbi:MAG: hypothetical protein K0R14_823 [Burkholderiales bacterium]|jgi:hypothetical protein|nr:hypothetical protein [Burkholderiales bacterium]